MKITRENIKEGLEAFCGKCCEDGPMEPHAHCDSCNFYIEDDGERKGVASFLFIFLESLTKPE